MVRTSFLLCWLSFVDWCLMKLPNLSQQFLLSNFYFSLITILWPAVTFYSPLEFAEHDMMSVTTNDVPWSNLRIKKMLSGRTLVFCTFICMIIYNIHFSFNWSHQKSTDYEVYEFIWSWTIHVLLRVSYAVTYYFFTKTDSGLQLRQ